MTLTIKRPEWRTGRDGRDYDMHDPKQFAAWEATFGLELDPIEREASRTRRARIAAPRADLTVDNDDLNYEAWLVELDRRDDESYDAWIEAKGLAAFGELVVEILIERECEEDDRNAAAYAASQKPRTEHRSPVTQDGIYRMADGTIVKVQEARNGSGHLYAKRLDVEARGFVYEPGLINRISAEQRMTVEEAAEFGRLYGICAVCGRDLTDEGSIEAGIGPVCAGRLVA